MGSSSLGIRVLQRERLPYAPMHRFKPVAFYERTPAGAAWLSGLNSKGTRYARAWHRAQANGWISVSMADELCVNVLHMHPAEVFGDLWFGGVE